MRTRRWVLGGIASVSGLGLAGCIGGGNETRDIGPVYESASSGSTTGEDGDSLPTFDGGSIALLWADLNEENDIIAVRGEVRNEQGFSFDNVRVEAQFVDDSDSVLQSSLATVQDLAAAGVWNFEVPYPGSQREAVASATITEIVHYTG